MAMDYASLGFRCGLEIHQQLEGRKLFCSCPTTNSDAEPDIKLERNLRAVAGETGHVDVAAQHEMAKEKRIHYQGDSSDVCLVELDEDPPHELNRDALKTTLQVAKLLNAKPVDEIRFMRKTVVDGSNVSGFQRTALIATDGFIGTALGKVGIATVCLEEEAAQKVKETKDAVAYKLDRLGIPLIEIGTSADIKNPEHAKEAAAYLGMVLRSVPGVKRGLGTIRQDVNVSISGGARTEIKGFQDLRSIIKVIESEVERQLALIKKKKKINEEVRKAEPNFKTTFLRPMPGAARMYPETDVAPLPLSSLSIDGVTDAELISDKLSSLEKKYGISQDKIKSLMKLDGGKKFTFFEELVKTLRNIKPAFLAELLLSYAPEVRRCNSKADSSKITEGHLSQVVNALDHGLIAKESVPHLLASAALGNRLDLSAFELKEIDLEKEIKNIVDEKPGLSFGGYMGIAMAKFRGKVDGKKVSEVLKRLVS